MRVAIGGPVGATVNQCEEWRKIGAGYDYASYTSAERKEASIGFNTQCRTAAAPLQEAIAGGSGDTEIAEVKSLSSSMAEQAAAWLRTNSRPSCPVDYPINTGLMPPPDCGPLDAQCVFCSRQVLDFNLQSQNNQRARCNALQCEYDCKRNVAVGRPEACRDCSGYQVVANTPPVCSTSFGPGYVSPKAEVDPGGQIVVDDSGASYYTALPADQIKDYQPLKARATNANLIPTSPGYSGSGNAVVPAPASGAGQPQPGVVGGGAAAFLSKAYGDAVGYADSVAGGGEGSGKWILLAVAGVGAYFLLKGK